jgi:hypothetical protein
LWKDTFKHRIENIHLKAKVFMSWKLSGAALLKSTEIDLQQFLKIYIKEKGAVVYWKVYKSIDGQHSRLSRLRLDSWIKRVLLPIRCNFIWNVVMSSLLISIGMCSTLGLLTEYCHLQGCQMMVYFKTKFPIWVNFENLTMEKMEYVMAILSILH